MKKYTHYSRPRKLIIEDSLGVDISKLKKWGFFEKTFSEGTLVWNDPYGRELLHIESFIDLENLEIELKNHEGKIKLKLSTTACNYGGNRYWLICPKCKEKKRCLYFGVGGSWCRSCRNLCYRSQNKGGIIKSFGKIIPRHELEEMLESLRKRYYRGVPTKKYQRYLKYSEKLVDVMGEAVKYL